MQSNRFNKTNKNKDQKNTGLRFFYDGIKNYEKSQVDKLSPQDSCPLNKNIIVGTYHPINQNLKSLIADYVEKKEIAHKEILLTKKSIESIQSNKPW